MKNYQVVPVNDIKVDIDFGNQKAYGVRVIALAFHEGIDGELKVKAVTEYDLKDGFVSFSEGDYDFIEGIKKADVFIK